MTARTDATNWPPYVVAARRSHRSVAHRCTGASLYWGAGHVVRWYASTACGKAMVDAELLHRPPAAVRLCRPCTEAAG